MYMLVGLGNPGLKYRHTRHNAGFDCIDVIAKSCGVAIKKKEKNGITGVGTVAGEKVLFVKPQTFMNNSGECVGALANFYKIPPENIIVISDDMELECGRIRIRRKGSAGGHNGLKSLIAHLKSENFLRLRIGVGRPAPGDDVITHVLGKPIKSDRILMESAFSDAASAAEYMISGDVDRAMNRYN